MAFKSPIAGSKQEIYQEPSPSWAMIGRSHVALCAEFRTPCRVERTARESGFQLMSDSYLFAGAKDTKITKEGDRRSAFRLTDETTTTSDPQVRQGQAAG